MAYTSPAAVAEHLNRELTAAQHTQIEALLPAADAWINQRTGRTWDSVAAITGEQHVLGGGWLWLRQAPVTSIQSIAVRSTYPGATSTTLTAGTHYELLDATTGLVSIDAGYAGFLATVAYTPALPLDSRIALAATLLVAHWLRPALDGVSGDVQQYTIGQELSVRFRDPATGAVRGVPDEVVTLVDQCGRFGGLPVFA